MLTRGREGVKNSENLADVNFILMNTAFLKKKEKYQKAII